jgi:pimeloyl-ACP methyl ester carboxylesterase
VTSQSVSLDGYTLSAHWSGAADDDAPLVVLLHGLLEPAMVWAPVIAKLPSYCRYVVLDMPWNGQQGGHWGMRRRPESWMDAAMKAFDLQPDAFVAHSFGASTLLSYLASDAAAGMRHGATILVSPFYKRRHAEFDWPLFRRYVAHFPLFVEESVSQRSGGRIIEPDLMSRMVETGCDTFGVYNWMEFWQLFSRMPSLDLQRLTQPVLLVSGADDFSAPPADLRALAAALPQCSTEILPQTGHFLLDSRHATLASYIGRFLGAHFHALP